MEKLRELAYAHRNGTIDTTTFIIEATQAMARMQNDIGKNQENIERLIDALLDSKG